MGWYGRQGLETGTTQRKPSVYPVAGWERTRGEQLSACERFKRFSVFCLRRQCAGGPHFCSSEQRSQPILRASSRTHPKKDARTSAVETDGIPNSTLLSSETDMRPDSLVERFYHLQVFAGLDLAVIEIGFASQEPDGSARVRG